MKSRSSNKSNLFRVKVKSTGKIIMVYKLLLGGYCDANNHTTTYAEANLEFLDNNENNNDFEKIDKLK
jgi:hypothetical protein